VPQGFSRRAWLLGVFFGLAGQVGLRRGRRTTPALSPTKGAIPPVPTTIVCSDPPSFSTLGSVTTFTYDSAGRLLSSRVDPQVATYVSDCIVRPRNA
jgi:YD repeat-containing protein